MKRLLILSAIIALTLPLPAQQGAPPNEPPVAVNGVGYGGPRPPIPTGPVPRLPDGTVDLYGAWTGGGSIGDLEKDGGLKPGELDALMLPSAKKLMASRTEDGDPHNYCMPDGIPRTTPFPFRFVQTHTHKKATHIFILSEATLHTYRQVFMDGRGHPADLDPTWMGHSIGRWDGDTLVIDTVGYNDKWWFDRRGHPHTEQLHPVERWTRRDMGHMDSEVTIDDPGAYSRPFTVRFKATMIPGDELHEYFCQENNQFGIAGGLVKAPGQ